MVPEVAHKWSEVRIHMRGDIPTDLQGFEEVSASPVFAYPEEFPIGIPEGDADDAREIAVTRVAFKEGVTTEEVLACYDVCIVPTQLKGQGKILARLKKPRNS